MGSSVNIALPSIGADFSLSAVTLGWIATSYLLASAVCLVPLGRAADIYGRKKVLVSGLALYGLFSAACAFSFSPSFLLAARVLQGASGAMIFATGVAILITYFPPGERGKALGINVAAVYAGLSLGPFLGGLLTQNFGWRSIFAVNALLGLAAALPASRFLPGDPPVQKKACFDTTGSVIYGVSMAAFVFALSRLPDINAFLLMAAGAAGLLFFIKWETKIPEPVMEIGLFRNNPVFAYSNAAALINYSATAAVAFFLSLYLQYLKGMTPQGAGLVLVSQPVVMMLLSPYMGRLSDRFEPRLLASAGMALTASGLALIVFLNGASSMAYIVFTLIVMGAGFALFSSPNTNAVMSSVDREVYGVASATLSTMRLTGQMLSMGISTMILSLFIGHGRITPDKAGAFIAGMKTAFSIFVVLCLLGIPASLARGAVHKKP
jgi:EmrB/QacA subfamily drug resistance transporter